jgi:hypothetical protein
VSAPVFSSLCFVPLQSRGADHSLLTKETDSYLDPGRKGVMDVAVDDDSIRQQLAALNARYEGEPEGATAAMARYRQWALQRSPVWFWQCSFTAVVVHRGVLDVAVDDDDIRQQLAASNARYEAEQPAPGAVCVLFLWRCGL